MTAAEIMTCHMLEDTASPVPMEGYVVSFVAFYQQGFGVPSHRFLCLLLQHYRLEMHNLTPLGFPTHYGLHDSVRGLRGD
jgi:hypothetical protein